LIAGDRFQPCAGEWTNLRLHRQHPGVTNEITGSNPQTPGLRVFLPDSAVVALGLAVNHLMTKPAFARQAFGDWARILVGQINRKHCCFAADGKAVQGFAGWALVSRENAEAWVEGRRLSYDDCVQGGTQDHPGPGNHLLQALLRRRHHAAGAPQRQRLRRGPCRSQVGPVDAGDRPVASGRRIRGSNDIHHTAFQRQ